MEFPQKFIGRTTRYATGKRPVCAPCLRRTFDVPEGTKECRLAICGLGFYRLYINAKDITKGLLSPYLSNPDHLVYCDEYDLTPYVKAGKNCIAILLGSGMLNAVDGISWDDVEQRPWRSAPKVALIVEADGKKLVESDDKFKTHDSPWYYEELRAGERYDARKEEAGWKKTDFDDASWDDAIYVEPFKGEMRPSTHVRPIRVVKERSAVAVTKTKKGFLYDFGYNTAGIFRMTIKSTAPGQTLTIRLGEWKTEGRLNQRNIKPRGDRPFQECVYICKGAEEESFSPRFSYYGFRYIEVWGIRAEQAEKDLFTMEAHTDMPRTGEETAVEIEAEGKVYGILRLPNGRTEKIIAGKARYLV